MTVMMSMVIMPMVMMPMVMMMPIVMVAMSTNQPTDCGVLGWW